MQDERRLRLKHDQGQALQDHLQHLPKPDDLYQELGFSIN